ncbi:SDR family NAD(P)-dependent oxidoreductase [Pseudomaricurvus alkylphenolicus]|jgi:NAD(P)-dependent dehydrogenase (short-subunit alcohol dehydrogenase family)|uniref:SDR family NAD(P)-dependent oxidoreductase n=1 Tax=Pseudomaricurvus alkylphenolicus TaxID=1306991 RepID=UPI0019805EE0|nr:SDR family oxidoreductase [Pseudomaricurvus alkylphenolicus]
MNQPHSTAVIVTGAASGIGRACAELLAAAARPVALWDLNTKAARRIAAEIREQYGVDTCALGIDISHTREFPQAVEASHRSLGSIGGLIHAAGISHESPVDTMTEEDWDHVQAINLRSYPFLIQALLPQLKRQVDSAIVGIASINAIMGNGRIPAYSVSKAGVMALTRSLSDSLGEQGIRINAICPGYIRTPMSQAAFDQSPGLEQQLQSQTFLNRIGTPEEIARVARFLLSTESSYITGQSIVVDAGATLSQL